MEAFESKSFYEILGVPKDAALGVIRKAYYKLAIKLHPDRNENKEQATKDFQKLALIKETLFDAKKRKYYDQTGEVDQSSSDFESAYEYWRARYAKVTMADIEKFKKEYQGSDEEKDDLREAYKTHKGDMHLIMDYVPLAEPSQVDRFINFYKEEIAAKNLKSTKKFKSSCKSISREEDLSEAKEAEELAKELGISKAKPGEGGLLEMIRSKHARREAEGRGFLAALEAKYCQGTRSSSSAKGKKKRARSGKKKKNVKGKGGE